MSLLCAILPLPSPPVPLCELVACTRCTSVTCLVSRGQWLLLCATVPRHCVLSFPPIFATCDRSACMLPGVASDHLTPPPPVYTSVESLILVGPGDDVKLTRLGTATTASGCFCSCHFNHQRAALVTRRVNNLSHGPGCPSVFVEHGQMPLFTAEGLRASGKEDVRGSEWECGRLGASFFPPWFFGAPRPPVLRPIL